MSECNCKVLCDICQIVPIDWCLNKLSHGIHGCEYDKYDRAIRTKQPSFHLEYINDSKKSRILFALKCQCIPDGRDSWEATECPEIAQWTLQCQAKHANQALWRIHRFFLIFSTFLFHLRYVKSAKRIKTECATVNVLHRYYCFL